MPETLLEKLGGTSGRAAHSGVADHGHATIRSIESSLDQLFRVRKGSVPGEQLMGVRDGSQIGQLLSANRAGLQDELSRMVLRYEPRIARVRFDRWHRDSHSGAIRCIMVATLAASSIRIPFALTFEDTTGGNGVTLATQTTVRDSMNTGEPSQDAFDD